RLVTKERISHVVGFNYGHNQTLHNHKKYPFTIVTAASSNHFCEVQSWLYYMKGILKSMPESKRPRILVYDIGLVNYQKKWSKVLLEKGYLNELRELDFEKCPEFWKINNETRGEYGWKPGVISDVIKDYPGPIFWLDSGTYVSGKFLKQFNVVLDYYDGFFSPISGGNMLKWTHPGVFKYFNDVPEKYSGFPNCNGAAIAFDSNRVGNLINGWIECAQVKECFAPEGSSRKNHRQDQAILTYLVAREKRPCVNRPEVFGLKIHMDSGCVKNVYFHEKLNNITWSPTKEDLKEMEMLKEMFIKHYIYDIWSPGAEKQTLDIINANETFNDFFHDY
ncbi:2080_t:CDS:1, partial [Entrophospora sp. SA101]